jgi:uncharacterized protein (TIGR02147 family)
MVAHLKATRPGFSFRSFARRAGFASPNYLKLVMDGLRNLAPESAEKFGIGLGLSTRESDVFQILVSFSSARNDEERNSAYVRLRERLVEEELTRLRDDQFAVYDLWWALVVREMALLPDFRLDAQWIARRLRPRIRRVQAERAIALLLRTGLLVAQPDGTVRPAERTISTGPEVQSLAARNYHRHQLALASRALDAIPRDERNVTSVTLVLDRVGYEEAVAEIARMRRRLLEIADKPRAADAGPRCEVHVGVFALIPVTAGRADRVADHDTSSVCEREGEG